ncbi:DUF2188 domain-containing protein [Aureimonas fodinaquatilis]|uniref:DUF2188 domain-containing protein n=1 Tax=Aureimonas fodinaquatilis TaxID=2565783 RepID=A0A5B0DZ94_9HYPH|nr:DUF2188 domain-containing protein [Aureimonas fodinaquatilis]KAA0971165.1 DUF2188 domain-containing protein [Aureimonas fodinaquatilis]
MADIQYHIVQHDGGWAYQVDGVFSETFRTHDDALAAARDAAARQELSGETEGIVFQTADGKWHREVSRGDDRPHADISDPDNED